MLKVNGFQYANAFAEWKTADFPATVSSVSLASIDEDTTMDAAGTTPSGRRRDACAQDLFGKAPPTRAEKGVEKWALFNELRLAGKAFDLSAGALTLLQNLLGFYPKDDLVDCPELVIFASNRKLQERANGISEATVRRHIVELIDADFIARQDSPTRKRYKRNGFGSEPSVAYGLSLRPFLLRAPEIMARAGEVKEERLRLKRLSEQNSILRRDIRAILLDLPADDGATVFAPLKARFEGLQKNLSKKASCNELQATIDNLSMLESDILNALESLNKTQNMSASEPDFERHKQDSKHNILSEFEAEIRSYERTISSIGQKPSGLSATCSDQRRSDELSSAAAPAARTAATPHQVLGQLIQDNVMPIYPGEDWVGVAASGSSNSPGESVSASLTNDLRFEHTAHRSSGRAPTLSLGTVIKAFPVIVEYGPGGRIGTWRELDEAVNVVRRSLQIGDAVFNEARSKLGHETTAIVVADILEKGPDINSPGGYLRKIVEKAAAGRFKIWPMVRAALNKANKSKRNE